MSHRKGPCKARHDPARRVDSLFLAGARSCVDPNQRPTIHPARYVAQFHNADDEPAAKQVCQISIDDNTKFSVSDYRDKLYRDIAKRKKDQRRAQGHKA